MKVVINDCYGGFSISDAACLRLRELGNQCAKDEVMVGEKYKDSSVVRDAFTRDSNCRDIKRDDPQLIQVIGELGEKANGRCAELKVIEIPDGIQWEVDEYDGLEKIVESHRSWS